MIKPRHQMSATAGRDAFRQALADWFKRHGRDYPWRRTHDPYHILVSEVMLQQTQIATVLDKGYYSRFLQTFPDVASLAAAADEPLLKAWEGLGYYRRAGMLRDTARAVLASHAGRFPQEKESLLKLPGIGPYTAGALRAFAFGQPAVLVDGNVSRVLSRLMNFTKPIDDTPGQKQIWKWAESLADDNRPAIYHAALMELGQTLCRPGTPDCQSCPVSKFCKTRTPEKIPFKSRKTTVTPVNEHALWLRDRDGRLLMQQESGKRRTGLWKLPLREKPDLAHLPVIAIHTYAITRYRVLLHVHNGDSENREPAIAPGDRWVSEDEISTLAMAAPFRKVIEKLLADL